jgi:hypothetical protein
MSARSDSPVPLSSQRKYSGKTLSCIAEAPTPTTQNQTFLYSPTLISSPISHHQTSPDLGNLYCFLRSPSVDSCSTFSTDPEASPPLPQHKFPSCPSLQHLCFECQHGEGGNNYAESWRIGSPNDGCSEEADIAELPAIYEKDFLYYASPQELENSRWSDDSEEKKKRKRQSKFSPKYWLTKIVEALGRHKKYRA